MDGFLNFGLGQNLSERSCHRLCVDGKTTCRILLSSNVFLRLGRKLSIPLQNLWTHDPPKNGWKVRQKSIRHTARFKDRRMAWFNLSQLMEWPIWMFVMFRMLTNVEQNHLRH